MLALLNAGKERLSSPTAKRRRELKSCSLSQRGEGDLVIHTSTSNALMFNR
jgi:hypothetical protein